MTELSSEANEVMLRQVFSCFAGLKTCVLRPPGKDGGPASAYIKFDTGASAMQVATVHTQPLSKPFLPSSLLSPPPSLFTLVHP